VLVPKFHVSLLASHVALPLVTSKFRPNVAFPMLEIKFHNNAGLPTSYKKLIPIIWITFTRRTCGQGIYRTGDIVSSPCQNVVSVSTSPLSLSFSVHPPRSVSLSLFSCQKLNHPQVFILTLLISEGRTGEAWEPFSPSIQ
jgi:hypothetical protein